MEDGEKETLSNSYTGRASAPKQRYRQTHHYKSLARHGSNNPHRFRLSRRSSSIVFFLCSHAIHPHHVPKLPFQTLFFGS
jgi:hypothetical protein